MLVSFQHATYTQGNGYSVSSASSRCRSAAFALSAGQRCSGRAVAQGLAHGSSLAGAGCTLQPVLHITGQSRGRPCGGCICTAGGASQQLSQAVTRQAFWPVHLHCRQCIAAASQAGTGWAFRRGHLQTGRQQREGMRQAPLLAIWTPLPASQSITPSITTQRSLCACTHPTAASTPTTSASDAVHTISRASKRRHGQGIRHCSAWSLTKLALSCSSTHLASSTHTPKRFYCYRWMPTAVFDAVYGLIFESLP